MAADAAPAGADDLRHCRELLRGGSRSFFAASFLLPRDIAGPASALYAFCRVADDLVDCGDGARGLDELRDRLQRIYDGTPVDHPADRAFAAVVEQMAIPAILPEALLDGFDWDVSGRRYDDLSALIDYSARVAGTVGAMMTLVMGRREASVLARACDLGVAMQLTNIARDVGEDAANGRLYLPRTWLVEAGIDPDAWLREPVFSPALAGVVARLLATAERLYRRATAGIRELPLACRPGIHAARLLYAEIGNQLARDGLDSVNRRAVVPFSRKLTLCLRALADTARRGPARLHAPPLGETHFLVAAVHPLTVPRPGLTTDRQLLADVDGELRGFQWVIDLFARLEARDREFEPGADASAPLAQRVGAD